MSKASENVSDRELFSELSENPIHPLLINIVPPFVNENSPMFHFQLNGEAVWRWREFCGQPSTELLQSSVLPLGYRLAESARERVGRAFAEILEKDTRQQKHEETETNASGDMVKTGSKPGGDGANTKRRVGAPYAR